MSRRHQASFKEECDEIIRGNPALGLVAITPGSAEAGWRSGWWGGPGVGIYVGPRYGYGYRNYLYRYRPYYYGRYAYSYGPRWKHRLPLLRLGKKGLAPRANLAGVERSGRKARTIHYSVSGSLQQTIGVGLAPALLVLLPFVYGTPAGIGRVPECGFF